MTFLIPAPRSTIRLTLPSLAKVAGWWTWVELAVVIYLARKGLWVPGAASAMIKVGGLWVASTTAVDLRLRLYTPKQLGLVWDNSRKTTWILYWAALAASGILFSGLLFGTAHGDYIEAFFFKKAGYLLGAFGQQFLVESYIFVRLERVLGKKAPWVTSLLFSLAHLPNPALTVVTMTGGYVSSLIFRRFRNLYSLALAHGIIGAALPAFWRLNMRVGVSYLRHLGF